MSTSIFTIPMKAVDFFSDLKDRFFNTFPRSIGIPEFITSKAENRINYQKIHQALHTARESAGEGSPERNHIEACNDIIKAAARLDAKPISAFELLETIAASEVEFEKDAESDNLDCYYSRSKEICLPGFGPGIHIQTINSVPPKQSEDSLKIDLFRGGGNKDSKSEKLYSGIITDANELIQARKLLTEMAA